AVRVGCEGLAAMCRSPPRIIAAEADSYASFERKPCRCRGPAGDSEVCASETFEDSSAGGPSRNRWRRRAAGSSDSFAGQLSMDRDGSLAETVECPPGTSPNGGGSQASVQRSCGPVQEAVGGWLRRRLRRDMIRFTGAS